MTREFYSLPEMTEHSFRKIRSIWEELYKSTTSSFSGIWILDSYINSFVYLFFSKENNFLPFAFPYMAENRSYSISIWKANFAGTYALIKKVSKIPKSNKSKEKEYLSYPENKSKPPTQKVPLPNYSTTWSHDENLEKQKWSFSLHRKKKIVSENFGMVISKKM